MQSDPFPLVKTLSREKSFHQQLFDTAVGNESPWKCGHGQNLEILHVWRIWEATLKNRSDKRPDIASILMKPILQIISLCVIASIFFAMVILEKID